MTIKMPRALYEYYQGIAKRELIPTSAKARMVLEDYRIKNPSLKESPYPPKV